MVGAASGNSNSTISNLASSTTAPSSSNPISTATINPLVTTDKALIQRQQEVMKMQDNMIVDIERGVDRLHDKVRSSVDDMTPYHTTM